MLAFSCSSFELGPRQPVLGPWQFDLGPWQPDLGPWHPRKLGLSSSSLALALSPGLVPEAGGWAARAGQDGGSGRRRDVAEKRARL